MREKNTPDATKLDPERDMRHEEQVVELAMQFFYVENTNVGKIFKK